MYNVLVFHVRVCVCVGCMHVCVCVCMYVCMCVFMYVCVCMYDVCLCVYVCMVYVRVCVFVCVCLVSQVFVRKKCTSKNAKNF